MNGSRTSRRATVWLVGAAMLSLTACGGGAPKVDNATTNAVMGPVVPDDPLPPTVASRSAPAATNADAIRVATLTDPRQAYAYLDKAAAMRGALEASAPSYGFTYDAAQPWVWRSADDAAEIVEPAASGNRTYYFRSREPTPFLVSNGVEAYGYDGGSLVVVYGGDGRPLAGDQIGQRLTLAALYLARGRDLWAAAGATPHEAVDDSHWQIVRTALAAERAQWDRRRSQIGAWRAYHQRQARAEADRWAGEDRWREIDAAALQKEQAAEAAADQAEQQMLAEARVVAAQSQARAQARALAQGRSQAQTQARPRDAGETRAQSMLGGRARKESQAQALWEAEAHAKAQGRP